ncbi:MAG TPA: GNAT family N-acetyltransferase [Atribacteraceae bacterium]|nr:GNAT family N-acetyltransferase [Atribacteraceae bacterium]
MNGTSNQAKFELLQADSLPDALSQLLELHRLCFSHYVGVLPSERMFLEWYLKRPGSGPGNVFVFKEGDTLISAVFLTLTRFRLGNDWYPVGIIDTVMTHPDYRNRGLASQLMAHAETVMRRVGCRFGYLYTILSTSQFTLYEKLGYRDHKRVFHLLKQSTLDSPPSRVLPLAKPESLRPFLNRILETDNGFVPLDDAMWTWRKLVRPPSLPAYLFTTGEKELRGTLTVSLGKVTTGLGDWTKAAYLSDWAGLSPEDLASVLHLALTAIPPEVTIDTLCPIDNQAEWDILRRNGFEAATAESAMLFPLDPEAEELMKKNRPGRWYPLIESVVGI